MAAAERIYQIMTFEAREVSVDEDARFAVALSLGADARVSLRGLPLAHYLEEMTEVRRVTLDALADRDDVWLERSLPHMPEMNAYWAWFHVWRMRSGIGGRFGGCVRVCPPSDWPNCDT